ncbi:MAG: asparagine synthase (glutamine-hydrolyzing) [Bacteroidetes bacterium]|nr:asparagine synthase (glutamine-hydrolyzing) [Bacteroidota bacterium]
MCGIAGVFNRSPYTDVPLEHKVKKMLTLIRHRGPDESGMYLGDNIAIGNVRLSIIDLKSGQQPLSDESGNYWIVYNGEVFNYTELREHILEKGVHLKTHCDTEVVVQLYAMYGAECLQYLNGQFSFCIWDKKNKECFLARDRVGILPLFYTFENNVFTFCSEMKGLLASGMRNKKLNPESMAQVFTFWTTIAPNTPFENIFQLPPGHYMRVNSAGLRIEKYWEADFSVSNNLSSRSESDTIAEYKELLKDAVRIRLRADVPVGAYLSGGLDSTVTTSLIHEINPDVLNTFSIGFEDAVYDETKYQMEAAGYLNTRHHAFKCTNDDISKYFEKTIWHTEFPTLRTSPTPMFLLSEKVRGSNIKVVITGEGADEYLAGYDIFKEAKIREFWAKEPGSSIRPKLLSRLYSYLPIIRDAGPTALKLFFGYKLNETGNPFYSHLLRWHNTSRNKTFFADDILVKLSEYDPLHFLDSKLPARLMKWSTLGKAQYLESTIFMSGYLLSSQGDRMLMANSVEGRYPFLDHRVIEFCNKLPDHLKLNGLNEKFLLKKMSEGLIPESIRKRVKQPYRAPIPDSFINFSRSEYVLDTLSSDSLKSYGLFNPVKVNALITKMNKQKEISEVDQMALTSIISTQLLYKMFIANSSDFNLNILDKLRIIREEQLA